MNGKVVLAPERSFLFDIAMIRAPAESREIEITVQTEPSTANPDDVRVRGTGTYAGTPLSAMKCDIDYVSRS